MQTTKSATKPAKQRKMIYNAPAHLRHKLFAAPLTSELRASHGIRNLPVRSGDTIRIMRGDHKGFEGKVSRIEMGKYRIFVEGLTREKVDGTTVFVAIHPSKVTITKLNLDDKWRKKILERKKRIKKEEIPEKPALKKPIEKAPEVAEVKTRPIEEKTLPQEKAVAEEKPKRAKRKIAKKPVSEMVEKEAEAAKKTEKRRTTRKRAKPRTSKKQPNTEGGT